MIPKIEQEDGYWYVSVNGERLGKFSSRTGALRLADRLARHAFRQGWEVAIKAQRRRLSAKRVSMSHDAS